MLVVLDGAADRSQRSLGWRTPLQAAETPNLDRLAGLGCSGHMYPLGPGVCPGSDQSHWRILGYGDFPYPGRSFFEAVGSGFEISPGETAFTANLATTITEGGERYVQAAPAHLPDEQAAEIAESLARYGSSFYPFRLLHLGGPFFIIVLGKGSSPLVTDSDPLLYRLPVREILPLDGAGEAAVKTAEELSRFSSWSAGVLESHPVNRRRREERMTTIDYVLIKWPSSRGEYPGFTEKWGYEATAVVSGRFYSGLARALGLELVLKEPSADPAGDLWSKLADAQEAMASGRDFVFVHTKAPDEAAHSGRPARKVGVLEELDSSLAAFADELEGGRELLAVITADHATPSGAGDDVIHSGESVPVLMVGPTTRRDGVDRFDEVSCAGGSLGLIQSRDIMPLMLNFTDRAKFGRSRLDPRDTPYRPRFPGERA